MTDQIQTSETAPAGNAAAPAAAQVSSPATPFAVFPDAESFQKRVDREAKKALKDLGIDDPSALRERLARAADLEKAAEEARLAQMSEIERAKAESAAHAEKLAQVQQELATVRHEARLRSVFSDNGVKNYSYGAFKVSEAMRAINPGEELDLDGYVKHLLADDSEKFALGAAAPAAPAAPPTLVARPVTNGNYAPPPAPPNPNQGAPVRTSKDMTPQEWAAYKSANGIHI